MAKSGGQKQGKHKLYGPKMANPRIKASKEHRNCGPLGYYLRDRAKCVARFEH